MIIFDLTCDNDHRFEGWFRSAEAFEQQSADGMIVCPQCDSHRVRRVPSAVAIATGSTASVPAPAAGPAETLSMLPTPTQMKGLYRQLMGALLANSEDVGRAFAEEARKIHHQEAPERPIHGQATAEERAALQDEGILVVSLPVVPEDDLN